MIRDAIRKAGAGALTKLSGLLGRLADRISPEAPEDEHGGFVRVEESAEASRLKEIPIPAPMRNRDLKPELLEGSKAWRIARERERNGTL